MQIDLPFYNEQPAEKDLKERESSSPDAPVDQIVTCIAQVLRENEPIDQTQQIDETILVQHHMHQIPDIVVIQPEVQQQSEVSVQVVPQDTLMPDVQPEVVPSEFTIEVEQPRNAARPRNVVGSSEEERIRRIRKQYETSPVESLEVGPLQNFINRKRRIPRFVKINRWNYGDSYKRKYPSIETLIRAAVKPDPAFAVFKPEMVFDDVRGVHSISGQTTRGSSLRISATDRTDSLGTPQADLAKTYMYQSTPLKRPSSQEVELGSHGKQQKLMELEPSLIENIQAPVLEQVSVSIVPMEQVPEVSAIPGQDTLAEQPIAHVEQTLVEEHVPVPVLMERDIIEEVIPIEVRVEEQLIIPELEKTTTVVEIAPTVKKVDPKVYFENRHKGILNKVKSWNIEEQGILGLEEIAEKPLTKLTVARAFSDVLQLCKLRYLVLYPEEDSNQLRSIEKGSKLC
ncbi:unnamed protein product [Brassicogethes aeneus]|uniref:Uncharacterized protein n=1 Tax=Brassicogethes aeneus TaxID=1431903 RepID=A0A9P0FIH5_BRAAE|nr:unnamed protein product [Brassicogethes aeneus]